METKECAWCGNTFSKKRHSKKEWAAVHSCSVSCASYYKWNKRSRTEADLVLDLDKNCVCCGSTLVRRNDEHTQAWRKRKYCNKSCAAIGKVTVRSEPKVITTNSTLYTKLHVTQYIPGTIEFQRVASLYM